jgi:hypothetical protein
LPGINPWSRCDIGVEAMGSARREVAAPRCQCRHRHRDDFLIVLGQRAEPRFDSYESDARAEGFREVCRLHQEMDRELYTKLLQTRKPSLEGCDGLPSCGKQMDVTKGLSIRRYELVKMPDGTNV